MDADAGLIVLTVLDADDVLTLLIAFFVLTVLIVVTLLCSLTIPREDPAMTMLRPFILGGCPDCDEKLQSLCEEGGLFVSFLRRERDILGR